MQTKEKDNLIFVRLFLGEEVYDCLEEICKKHNVETNEISKLALLNKNG